MDDDPASDLAMILYRDALVISYPPLSETEIWVPRSRHMWLHPGKIPVQSLASQECHALSANTTIIIIHVFMYAINSCMTGSWDELSNVPHLLVCGPWAPLIIGQHVQYPMITHTALAQFAMKTLEPKNCKNWAFTLILFGYKAYFADHYECEISLNSWGGWLSLGINK